MTRRGFQLAEVMVGMAVVAGPLFMGSQLIHTSGRGAQQVQEHFAARVLLGDLLELLQAEPIERLQTLDSNRLEALIDRHLEGLPAPIGRRLKQEIQPFRGHIAAVTTRIPGAVPLVRVSLQVAWSRTATVRVSRTWREAVP
jgi:hypothetical protein